MLVKAEKLSIVALTELQLLNLNKCFILIFYEVGSKLIVEQSLYSMWRHLCVLPHLTKQKLGEKKSKKLHAYF